MRIKTADLVGPALDWAVATTLNLPQGDVFGRGCVKDTGFYLKNNHGGFEPMLLQNTHDKWVKQCETYPWSKGQVIWRPSIVWSQGGPIIEREGIYLRANDTVTEWAAGALRKNRLDKKPGPLFYAKTPLIAAMRCFVASRLGDEVDVPEELL